MTTTAQRAIGYVRVSTQKQATEGVSLSAQRERIAAWCQVNGYELGDVFADEGISGSRADTRPGLQAAITAACKAKAALVVYSLSRLARSTRDAITIAERIDKAGADLVSLSERIDTTTAGGRMIFRMLAVLGEYERDLIGERTSTALEHKRARGEYTGGAVPYGWRINGDGSTLVPHDDEQRVLRTARKLREAGASLRGIATELDRKGHTQRNGKAWHPQCVKKALSAPLSA